MTRIVCCSIAFLVVTSGCAGRRYSPGPVVERPEQLERLTRAIERGYPDQFTLVQRVVLVAGGKQYQFQGYLAVRRGQAFRAVAFGEIGGTIFDILATSQGVSILANSAHVPGKPLILGVAEDIRHLFDPPRSGPCRMTERQPGQFAVVRDSPGGGMAEWRFDSRQGQIAHSKQTIDGKIVREAEYADYRRFAGSQTPLPARIVLRNLRWRYRLEVDLVELRTAPAPDAAFQPPSPSERVSGARS